MQRAAAARIIAERFRPAPGNGVLEERRVYVRGCSGTLVIERVGPRRLRASIALDGFRQAFAYGREVAAEAHRIACEALAPLGHVTGEGMWSSAFTVDAVETDS